MLSLVHPQDDIPQSSSSFQQSQQPFVSNQPPLLPLHPSAAESSTLPPVPPPLPSRKGKGKEKEMLSFVDGHGERLWYRTFGSEEDDLDWIMKRVEEELSEPYNVYTYRYFLNDFPHLTWLVYPTSSTTQPIALIICKTDPRRDRRGMWGERGYIAMLSVERGWRRRGIARRLVEISVEEMKRGGAKEVMLETEYDNLASLALYDKLGFLREKRLYRFYSNGKDAFRLILPLEDSDEEEEEESKRRLGGDWSRLESIEESDEDDCDQYFI
ncbi:hypothetical protein L204_104236 [Cryptococcus depauperatus]|nr:hypothetical protein L204_04939 [Cryptococcus depauperatus CBS 7855]